MPIAFGRTVTGLRVLLLAAAAWLASGCSGGDTQAEAPAAPRAAAFSLPQYDPATETLSLPALRAGDRIHADVKLRLLRNGTWSVASSGASRAVTPADPVGPALSEPGASTSLSPGQTDATLRIPRLHAGAHVLGNVAIRLSGAAWRLAAPTTELKALSGDDFQFNPKLTASESHHISINAGPQAPRQGFPLQLRARTYRFCMEAQTGGADSITLSAPDGAVVFSLSAGQECVTVAAAAGVHRLEHLHGGGGASRTLFMRNPQASAAPTGQLRQPSNPVAANGSPVAAATLTPNEFWALNETAPQNNQNWLYASPLDFQLPQDYCAASVFTQTRGAADVLSGSSFFGIWRDGFGNPSQLDLPARCLGGPASGFWQVVDPGSTTMQGHAFPPIQLVPTDPANRASNQDPVAKLTLGISEAAGSAYELTASSSSGSGTITNTVGFDGLNANLRELRTQQAFTRLTRLPAKFAANMKYFRALTQAGAPQLATGDVLVFTKPACEGAAILTSEQSLPYLVSMNLSAQPFTGSVLLGPSTRARFFSRALYAGTPTDFNQQGCANIAAGASAASMQVVVDTITLTLTTNGCAGCNLAGASLAGASLANADFTGADLSGAVLSKADLTNATLQGATLQGADLSYANLEGANLQGALLNGSSLFGSGVAATLDHAHMKNTNLSLATLDGASFAFASFYGVAAPASCAPPAGPECATAYGASMTNTRWTSAYLAKVNMDGGSNPSAIGADFSSAAVIGVSFNSRNFTVNSSTGNPTTFLDAYLQGTDFSSAVMSGAVFTNAVVDTAGTCVQVALQPSAGFSLFPGFKRAEPLFPPTCVSKPQVAQICLQVSYVATNALPATDASNTCVDGSRGTQNGCAAHTWTSGTGAGAAMPYSSCTAANAVCGPSTNVVNQTIDYCW